MNFLNAKQLIAIVVLLAGIAASIAYRNAQQARKEAELARQRQEIQRAMKNSNKGWGGSADTIRTYRPK